MDTTDGCKVYRYGPPWWGAVAGLFLLAVIPLSLWTLLELTGDLWPLPVTALVLAACCVSRWVFPCKLVLGPRSIRVPSLWSWRTVEINYESIREIRRFSYFFEITHCEGVAKINGFCLGQDFGDVLHFLEKQTRSSGEEDTAASWITEPGK
jgi:hypothetical protein